MSNAWGVGEMESINTSPTHPSHTTRSLSAICQHTARRLTLRNVMNDYRGSQLQSYLGTLCHLIMSLSLGDMFFISHAGMWYIGPWPWIMKSIKTPSFRCAPEVWWRLGNMVIPTWCSRTYACGAQCAQPIPEVRIDTWLMQLLTTFPQILASLCLQLLS